MRLKHKLTTTMLMGLSLLTLCGSPVAAATGASSSTTSSSTIHKITGKVTIHYVPGYGVAVWRTPAGKEVVPGKKLMNGTSWRVFEWTNIKGKIWYNLGGNQWVAQPYAHMAGDPENTEIIIHKTVTIHYVPGYGIALWASPDSKSPIKGRTLKTGTHWKVFSQLDNGLLWYKVGKDQWIQALYTK